MIKTLIIDNDKYIINYILNKYKSFKIFKITDIINKGVEKLKECDNILILFNINIDYIKLKKIINNITKIINNKNVIYLKIKHYINNIHNNLKSNEYNLIINSDKALVYYKKDENFFIKVIKDRYNSLPDKDINISNEFNNYYLIKKLKKINKYEL